MDVTLLSFLQTFWWDSTLSILRMQYNSKSMELTRFILWKGIHSVFGFLNGDSKLFLVQNHVLLMFKIYIHNSRGSEPLKIKSLIREITKVKNIEEK